MKTWLIEAEGKAMFSCYVNAETREEAIDLFNAGEFESEQNDSWVEDLCDLEKIQEIK